MLASVTASFGCEGKEEHKAIDGWAAITRGANSQSYPETYLHK